MSDLYSLSTHNEAEIFEDNTIRLKIGMRRFEIQPQAITGFYRYTLTEDSDLLVVAYQVGAKNKRVQILLDRLIPQPFVDALAALAPESANLTHMEKKDALRLLGVADGVRQGILALAILVPVIIAAVYLPQIWHRIFDSKPTPTTIEDLYSGNLNDSGYLSFTTNLKKNGMIVSYKSWSTFFTSDRSWKEKGFFALVPADWRQGDPIKVVLMVDGAFNLKEILKYAGKEFEVSGIVRNILWEKYSWTRWMGDLAEHENSPVEDPIVVEYNTSPANDFYWTFGLAAIFMGAFFIGKIWEGIRDARRV